MDTAWYQNAIFYHIYPLGLSGAPAHNDFTAPMEQGLNRLYPWLDQAQSLGCNALYLGPVFQSSSHGYDTSDYYQVDRRLGDNDGLAKFSTAAHQHGLRLVLDGVFNHVGRDFWAFRDVLEQGENSPYAEWFQNLSFGEISPMGDPFCYEGWQGHYSLVKLNLAHPHVQAHLFDAVGLWMDRFNIDGLRLDAADCIDFNFLRALRYFVKNRQPDFWLMGEVVHGDYRDWVNPETLDSVTNYECYKGLFSSLIASNYFEVAYSLDRQFGEQGLYRDLSLYNFVDNHDVDRVASKLIKGEHLFPLYLLLFSMPGVPSVYYGSEWGIQGVKGQHSDAPLRPVLDLNLVACQSPHPDLVEVIGKLAAIRHRSTALSHGDYQPVHVDHQQLAFIRQSTDELMLVVLNSAPRQVNLNLRLNGSGNMHAFEDLLEPGEIIPVVDGEIKIDLPASWGRLLKGVG
jgi:cyclomaltodextrinase / maltogenic alpha-amylase / neopullulanase